MKRLLIVIALLCVVSSSASAWPYPPVDVSLNRADNSVHGLSGFNFRVKYDNQFIGVGGGGFFNVNVSGVGVPLLMHQLICVDIGTYISGSAWNAIRHYVPPSPVEPPFSMPDAVALFYHYADVGAGVGHGGWRTDTRTAGALQLALWEITHEVSWRDGFNEDWWKLGDSQIRAWDGTMDLPIALANAKDTAYAMLSALNSNQIVVNPRERAFFYQPNPDWASQGLLGGAPSIPEPSTLILLGLGLTAAGVGVVRRRRKA